ncbi:MAG: hypothetical protein U0271_17375 [Polyangiaceae bacterium]
MAITFNPSSLDFGSLTVGDSSPRQVVITNTGSSDVAVTAPSVPFAMSPANATVPGNSTLTVMVVFRPMANGSFTESLAAGGVTCSLTGSADSFASEGDSTETTTNPFGVPANAGVKYYQISVPNFQEIPGPSGTIPSKDASGATIPTFHGNSFLRLGSSPSLTDWSTLPFSKSVALARIAADPAQIAAAEGIQIASGAIASSNQEGSNASVGGTSGTTFVDTFVDGAGTPGPYGYLGDPNYLLGFADDTRFHSLGSTAVPLNTMVNGASAANDAKNRQAETLRLLTKGGWWDHSDGNRITTTSGDKIEVIQGNYKMVVLGRQVAPNPPVVAVDLRYCVQQAPALSAQLDTWYKDQTATNEAPIDSTWALVSATNQRGITAAQIREQYRYTQDMAAIAGNTLVTDVSGGHFQEQYPSPTPCIKTTELSFDGAAGEWTLYQDNGVGNLITKLKGRTVDLFQGKKREAYVGSAAGTTVDASLDPELISKTWAQKIFSQTGSETKPVGAGTTPTDFPGSMPTSADGLNSGDVFSVTWAQRILSYTGSSRTPVPYVYSETYAKKIKSVTNATEVVSETTVTGGDIQSTSKAISQWSGGQNNGGKVRNETAASVVTSVTTASGDVINVTAAGGTIINVSSALDLLTLNAGLDILNFNVGVASVFNLNLGVSMFNIDLTPISLHFGIQACDMAVQKYVTAANVSLGAPNAPPAAPVGVAKAAVIIGAIGGLMQGGLGSIESVS